MTPQYKPGDRVWHKFNNKFGCVQEVRKDGTVVVLWDGESPPRTPCYTPQWVDDYVEPAPADQPLTDAQMAQVVDALIAKLTERQPAAPEGDPSRIQVGDTVLCGSRRNHEATVVAVQRGKACLLDSGGLSLVGIHNLTKVTAHG